jgi:hypothetical protein
LLPVENNFSSRLPIVLAGCETWSVTLREQHRSRVFENKEEKGIFGPKRDEVTGDRGASKFLLVTKYCQDKKSKDEMEGVGSGHEGDQKQVKKIGSKA